jgi:hypothetical protein
MTRATLMLISIMTLFWGQAGAETAGYDSLSTTCKEKLFPISSGGSKDEKVSCTMDFGEHGLIIVAGNSTSEDFAPAANDHAFVYAVDLEGNWQWGKFFYNVSFAISTISGCSKDDNGNAVFLGVGNSVPIIMELNPKDGQVLAFISLDKIGSTATSMPFYATYGAIYHDLKDSDDGQAYYYAAFHMDDHMEVVKVNKAQNTVKWNYQWIYTPAGASDTYINKKIPGHFHQDPSDNTRLYLMG